jgi:hypothetical protein
VQTFCRVAFYETAWRATLGTVAAIILMICFRAEPALALLIGGHVALLFAAVMIVYAGLLTEDRVELTDPWLALDPSERPVGAPARHWARHYLMDLMLRFARGGAAVASVLAGLALLLRA